MVVPGGLLGGGIQEAVGNLLPSSVVRSPQWRWGSEHQQHRDGVQSHGQECNGRGGQGVPGQAASGSPPFPQGPPKYGAAGITQPAAGQNPAVKPDSLFPFVRHTHLIIWPYVPLPKHLSIPSFFSSLLPQAEFRGDPLQVAPTAPRVTFWCSRHPAHHSSWLPIAFGSQALAHCTAQRPCVWLACGPRLPAHLFGLRQPLCSISHGSHSEQGGGAVIPKVFCFYGLEGILDSPEGRI